MSRWLFAVSVLACAALTPGAAFAHATSMSVYSKLEATAEDRSLALVFALERDAVLLWAERDTGRKVDLLELPSQREAFSQYLFARFFVANEGVQCRHPSELSEFFWDEPTRRVLAVTRFLCDAPIRTLQIHSLVTHDLPIAHELVADLLYGETLTREHFFDDNNVVRVTLGTKAKTDKGRGRHRSRFSHVAQPDRKRRYTELAGRELSADAAPGVAFVSGLRRGAFSLASGYHHLLCLLALVLCLRTRERLVRVMAAFASARALSFAALGLDTILLSPVLEAPIVAGSVLVLACVAITYRGDLVSTSAGFALGIVHGLLFTDLVAPLDRAQASFSYALGGMELGLLLVEAVFVLACALGLFSLQKRERWSRRTQTVLCGSLALWAVVWLCVRMQPLLA